MESIYRKKPEESIGKKEIENNITNFSKAMHTSQEKSYQKIATLFQLQPSASEASSLEEKEQETPGETGEMEEEKRGEFPVSIKKSITIECQGRKYAYHLGEVLRKKWNIANVLNPSPTPPPEEEAEGATEPATEDIQKGGNRLFFSFGGGEEGGEESITDSVDETAIQLRFCLFEINTDAIVPFLKFWLVPIQDGNTYGFPETTFSPLSNYKDAETEEEEEHAEFLDVCRKKFVEMRVFQEEQEEAMTTERMERNYHGYITSPDEKNVVYVFYQMHPPTGVIGKWGVIDEIVNQSRLLGTPIDARIRSLFYSNHEILYIYGSPVSPMDALFHGVDSEYDSSNESAQEIPYCLYLCQDKSELSEEDHEGKTMETLTGKILGLEEPHYLSPKDKYRLSKKEQQSSQTLTRTEDEYGYFYYFTNHLLEENKEEVARYAVFVYNTDYRLDKATFDILKSLDMEKRLVGGKHWKMDFSLQKWLGGGLLDYFLPKTTTPEKGAIDDSVEVGVEIDSSRVEEDAEEDAEDSEEGAEEEDKIYASIYYQRDDIPLWCIKNTICIAQLE